MPIVVFGATGHLGALVLESLTERGVEPGDVVAAGRDQGRLQALASLGHRIATVDYNDPSSVADAIMPGDRVLLISGSEVGRRIAQHGTVIDAARLKGVAQFVYTSAPRARDTALVLAPEHKATEEAIEAAGLPATILRNGWYTENYRGDFDHAAQTGVIANSVGDGRVASAPRRNFAEAAATVLTTDGHVGKVYELSGDSAWSFDDFAKAAAEVLGKPVVYQALSPEAELAALRDAGLDESNAGFVVALNGNTRDGLLGETTGDLSALIGHPTEPLEQTMRSWQ